jgi:hypothetical protein
MSCRSTAALEGMTHKLCPEGEMEDLCCVQATNALNVREAYVSRKDTND